MTVDEQTVLYATELRHTKAKVLGNDLMAAFQAILDAGFEIALHSPKPGVRNAGAVSIRQRTVLGQPANIYVGLTVERGPK